MRWLWLPMLALTAYLTVTAAIDGSTALAVIYGAVGLALTWWLSPFQRRGGRSHAEVLAIDETERPVAIYWRPGCAFCLRLRSALGGASGRAMWVNIWQDTEAAAYVRSVNDGNETVPTVVIGGVPHTNPDPALVRAALAA